MAINTDKRVFREVYLSLGSNMGNRKLNLEKAIELLENEFGKMLAVSSLYKTAGWGSNTLDWFYNQVVCFKSIEQPKKVLEICLSVENFLGRDRKIASEYQNRLIDIDVLLVGDLIMDEKELKLPHPHLHLRNFVLYPFEELSPDTEHPILNKTVKQLKNICEDGNLIEKIE